MFERWRRGRLIDPGEWPAGEGTRVLIEHGDASELWAEESILREAGYQVAVCRGPSGADGWPKGPGGKRRRCPLVCRGRCTLAAGADIVICDSGVGESEALVRSLAATGKRVVFQAPEPLFARFADVPESVRLLRHPVTERTLLDAVADPYGPQRSAPAR